jgi:hypothetical protein
MGIGASASSHSTPISSAHHGVSLEHDQDEDDWVENIPNRPPKTKFLLFNEKCLEKSTYFMQNALERKIFCKFILQEHWRGKLNSDLKRIIINQLPQAFGSVEKFNPLAKKISINETFTDNFLHQTNNSTIELFNAPQLQSILIVCCLSSYFQQRSGMDLQAAPSQQDMLSSECIHRGLLMRSSSMTDDDRDDDLDADGAESKSCSMVSMDSEEIDQYDKNPEILLSNIGTISTEAEIDRLLASGAWISHVMTSFADLKSTICIWDTTPQQEKGDHKTPNTPTLLYCSKRHITTDTDELHAPSSRSTACIVTVPTRDSTLSTTTTNLYTASTPNLSTSPPQTFTSAFSEPFAMSHSTPPVFLLPSSIPTSTISDFLCKDTIQHAIRNQQLYKTTIQDKDSTFIQSSYVIMLPYKTFWKKDDKQFVITIQHPISGSSYDRMLIRMSDLIVFTLGILIAI